MKSRSDLKPIDFFDGTEFDWLSNFHPCVVDYAGITGWPTTEHAYQAMKALGTEHRERIRAARSPGEAKALGQAWAFKKYDVRIDPMWETVKYDIMIDLLRLKFAQPKFRDLLLATGNRPLIEGNHWNDTCWGVCNGVGANNLGRSLMLVRAECQRDRAIAHARRYASFPIEIEDGEFFKQEFLK